MNDDWEVYFCHVHGNPATILLNLALLERAPVREKPLMAYMDVSLRHPDESGLTTEEEFPRLLELEDAILEGPGGEDAVLYAGRCATDGQWTFFFYLADGSSWRERLRSVMSEFPEYSWDSAVHEEPGWETYLEFLYPDKADLDGIRNERVRRQLAENGDDLEMPRPVEHWLIFSTPEERDGFRLEASKFGFTAMNDNAPPLSGETEPEQESGERFNLAIQRSDAPADMDDVTLGLHEMAEPFGGSYLGWSTTMAPREEE